VQQLYLRITLDHPIYSLLGMMMKLIKDKSENLSHITLLGMEIMKLLESKLNLKLEK
jgi:hypothetical protein